MSLTCRSLLKIPYASQMELATGEEGLGNVILRTHVLEILGYIDFVQKGDLIITIGYVLKNDKEKWREFIYELNEKEIAGLAIDVERLHTDTVEWIQSLCTECGCPLFIMPVEMRTPDLQESISRVLFEESMKFMMAEKFFLELMFNNTPISPGKLKRAEKYGFDFEKQYYLADIALCMEKGMDLQDKSKVKQTYRGISGDVYMIYDEAPVEQIKTILYGCVNGLETRPHIIVNGEHLILLVSPDNMDIRNLIRNICDELEELDMEYKIGVSSRIMGIENIHTGYEQAVFAGRRCNQINSVGFFETFGIEAIIHNSPDKELLQAICESILGPILKMKDESKKEEILETLHQFIEHNCNYEETAEVLYCHSNTVRNRISDIEKRLGISRTNFKDMFHITLALAILNNDL